MSTETVTDRPPAKRFFGRLAFLLERIRFLLARSFRNGWFRLVRAPIGRVVWWLWAHRWVRSDRVISRRNAINNLPGLTWVQVSPASIRRCVRKGDVKRKYFFWGGDWDRNAFPITEHSRYRLMADVWRHREAPDQGEMFTELLSLMEQGKPLKMANKGYYLDTPEQIMDFLEAQLNLFASLEAHGICPELAPDEINVAIGRDGEIIKANGGRKRTIAAQLLGMEQIPVRVAYVHRDWVRQFLKPGDTTAQALKAALKSLQH